MNYVKKMCILRQIKQGFSADGRALSGLIKAEQYGKNLAVEVSIINFAPLAEGEYYCLISDGKGRTEMLCLRGKSFFNILSDMDISAGFCAVVCHVKTDVVPIAYGVNGNGNYDWKSVLNAALPPVFPHKREENNQPITEKIPQETDTSAIAKASENPIDYDDENIVENNYYEQQEQNNERQQPEKNIENAHGESPTARQTSQARQDFAEDGNAASVLHAFKTDSDGYYTTVRAEIDELFKNYPRDKTLAGAFSCGDWVRVKGTAQDPQYLVGVLFENGRARYICYALKAENRTAPPEEIKNVCTFVPFSAYDTERGFFVIFQSAATGECIKPERA